MTDSDHVKAARDIYNLAASRYVDFVGTEISSATEADLDRSLLVEFSQLVQAGSDGTVADFGCGPGRVAAFLSQKGLDVIGLDLSLEMLMAARSAHPHIPFEEGELAALPIGTDALVGAVYWYSIIYTPPFKLRRVFDELTRVLRPFSYVLLGFQAGQGDSIHREQAHGTPFPLTSYLHSPQAIVSQLEDVGFAIHTSVVRDPDLRHETTPQGFIIARLPGPNE